MVCKCLRDKVINVKMSSTHPFFYFWDQLKRTSAFCSVIPLPLPVLEKGLSAFYLCFTLLMWEETRSFPSSNMGGIDAISVTASYNTVLYALVTLSAINLCALLMCFATSPLIGIVLSTRYSSSAGIHIGVAYRIWMWTTLDSSFLLTVVDPLMLGRILA